MKAATRKYAASSANETTALLRSFSRIRILHVTPAKPVQGLQIREKLESRDCPVDAPALSRMLRKMVRNGWLKNNSPLGSGHVQRDYSLTPKGRKVLNLTRERLKGLMVVLEAGDGPRVREVSRGDLTRSRVVPGQLLK
ncbi:MAG: PadR family transcriptional regulator [Verrucomicrobia bacterium]|nr:PadR family transcriptional regulator [Verrucomicrobiota bacterium]